MPDNQLVLRRSTDPGAYIHFRGDASSPAVLDWHGAGNLVTVLKGHWRFENVQLGTRRKTQRQGFVAESSGALLDLHDVVIRTASYSGGGIVASRAGRVHLYGDILLNEDLHQVCEDKETYCGIRVTDHGTVKFMQREGALLSMGNGSLAASYYGVIRLGCEKAEITCWTNSNNLAIGNSGRIDLHGTETLLRAMEPDNTLIGPEDDGHIMAENTHVVLESHGNRSAIYLQKSSTVFGGPFEFRGEFMNSVVTMSGSIFVGTVTGDVSTVYAITGSQIILEGGSTPPTGRIVAQLGGTVVLPSGDVVRERVIEKVDGTQQPTGPTPVRTQERRLTLWGHLKR